MINTKIFLSETLSISGMPYGLIKISGSTIDLYQSSVLSILINLLKLDYSPKVAKNLINEMANIEVQLNDFKAQTCVAYLIQSTKGFDF